MWSSPTGKRLLIFWPPPRGTADKKIDEGLSVGNSGVFRQLAKT